MENSNKYGWKCCFLWIICGIGAYSLWFCCLDFLLCRCIHSTIDVIFLHSCVVFRGLDNVYSCSGCYQRRFWRWYYRAFLCLYIVVMVWNEKGNTKKNIFSWTFEGKTLSLQRVFHSIRFKVNKVGVQWYPIFFILFAEKRCWIHAFFAFLRKYSLEIHHFKSRENHQSI